MGKGDAGERKQKKNYRNRHKLFHKESISVFGNLKQFDSCAVASPIPHNFLFINSAKSEDLIVFCLQLLYYSGI
jgi:hypothetical protein